MLSVEDNETLSHVGPGTVMGDLLRQYWVPALLSEELPRLTPPTTAGNSMSMATASIS